MTKTFKSYKDLLIFLQDEKNLIIDDFDAALHILYKTSYFPSFPVIKILSKTQ